ncbi:MAG: hypothetical protein Kow00117_11850 [Phototrophicales bacterium]
MMRYVALILIFLLAAAGRIIHIDTESLWVDEGFSYWAIRHHDMLGLILRDVHPPLYFIGLRGWAQVAGISELALRYFSVLPSLLSVAMIYQLAREVGYLRRHTSNIFPMLAALMLALADMENYIAQQARMYTWHVLWVIVSMWAFLRWQRVQKRFPLIIWAVSSLLLIYTHYIGLAALGVQGVYALIFLRDKTRQQAIIVLMIVVSLFIPWMLAVVSNQTANVGTGFNVPSTLESLWNWRIEWFTGQWALLMGLAFWGLLTWQDREFRVALRSGFLLVMWVVVPVAGAYILNYYTPILMDYRLTQITPAIALLIALGLSNFRQPTLGFLVAVILVYGVAINDTPRPRPPWREVGRNAALYAQAGDLALAHVEPSGDWQVMYYFERFMPNVERRSIRQWKLESPQTYGFLPDLLRQYPHVWYMHWSSDMDVFRLLAETGHVQTAVMSEDWLGNDLNVYRFDILPDTPIITYQNGMILRDFTFIPEQQRLDLWWSVDTPLTADYTISAFLLDSNGVLVAQNDAQPFNNQRPTTTFEAGEVVYDPHVLLPDVPAGTYTLAVKIYLWTPQGLIVQQTADGAEFATLGTVRLP